MYFTQEDYRKIEAYLKSKAVRDTSFDSATTPLQGNETIVLVQGGKNVNTTVSDIVSQFFALGVSDFINVTDKYGISYNTLDEAIRVIPWRSRKVGQVITFLNEQGEWHLYQYQGESILTWNNTTLWVDLLESRIVNSILPDQEDLTMTEPDADGNSYMHFKDKDYSIDDFSGLGRVYLRKNLQTLTDPNTGETRLINYLTQTMVGKENVIYHIQYDYNLNGQTIIIPEGCVLLFEGGSVSNGTLNFINTSLVGDVSLNVIPTGTLNNDKAYIEWFKSNTSTVLQFLINSGVNEVIFGNTTYSFKDIVLNRGIVISGSGNTIFKPILIRNEDSAITHSLDSCRNMLQSSTPDISVLIRNITFKSTITTNTLPSGYKTDKYASEPLLFFTDARKVEVTNCIFDSIEGNSYSNTNYTYYGNKKGLCVCCWDCDEVIIHNNFMTRLRMDEQFWAIAVHKDRETLITRFNKNYVKDMQPTANSSLFSSVAGTVEFNDNYVNNFVYTGSLTNLFGTHVIAKNNIISNTQVGSVFDTSERGYFYANDILIADNTVDALSGDFVVTIANIINIRNNKFKGFTFLTAENDASISQMLPSTYPYFYTKDTIKPANTYINIDSNNIDLTYYDKTIVRIVPKIYSKGINIRSWQTIGGKFVFKNNIMTSLQSFDADDVNNMGNYQVVPFWLSNMKQIIIEGNNITGGGTSTNITSVKSVIWAGHYYTYDQGETAYTLDELTINGNTFSTNASYILLSTTNQYTTKWYTITKFNFINNISPSNKTIAWSLPVVFRYATIRGNVSLQLSQYPFVTFDTDITDLGYRLGRIKAYRRFREEKTNAIAYTADLTSEYNYEEATIAVGTRLEIGNQMLMSDNTIWKNIGTVTSWQASSTKEIQSDTNIMKYQGVFWRKLLSRKVLIFDSPATGTTEQREAVRLNSWYYGLIWYDTTLQQNFQYNNGGWYNEDGTLTSKVVIV